VKTGIQRDIVRHDFWIPTYVGMTKRLKISTYDTKPLPREGGRGIGSKSPHLDFTRRIRV
jgi:hypothetical protein